MHDDTLLPKKSHRPGRFAPAYTLDNNDHIHLVERARAKDPEAMRELIILFRPLVERVARRRCSRANDVEDVIQEVWVSLLAASTRSTLLRASPAGCVEWR